MIVEKDQTRPVQLVSPDKPAVDEILREDAAPVQRKVLVSLAIAVCIAIFSIKTYVAYRDLSPQGLPPRIYDGRVIPSLFRIFACCAEDFAVGTILLGIGLGAVSTIRSPRLRSSLLIVIYFASAACLLFAVVNAELFHVLRRFLNVSLLRFSGGLKLNESILPYASSSFVFVIIASCVGTFALQRLLFRLFPAGLGRTATCMQRPLVLVLLLAALFGISHVARSRWFPEDNDEFARNPHLLFVRSCFWTAHFGEVENVKESDFDDFRPGHKGPAPVVADAKAPKNVVLVVLESVSAPYLQVYGSPFPTTPWLSSIRDESLVCRNVYANATHTAASVLGLFASRYNDPTACARLVDFRSAPVYTVPDWLQEHGYRTYFLGGGDWEYCDLGTNLLSHGFDLARDSHRHWSLATRPWPLHGSQHSSAMVFDDAIQCLRESKDQNFFMMIWSYDSHIPYRDVSCPETFDEAHFPALIQAPPDHRLLPNQATGPQRRDDFRRFLGTVWEADRNIRRLYDELKRLGIAESTVIVVTGDHGDAFGEHGWFCHGHALYEEDVNVPFILISPQIHTLGLGKNRLGGHIDMWPTLAELCGIPIDPNWQGKNLFESAGPDRAYFYRAGSIGIREGKYKYVWDYVAGGELLFDLEKDPREMNNIAREHPESCVSLRRRLSAWAQFQSSKIAAEAAEGNR